MTTSQFIGDTLFDGVALISLWSFSLAQADQWLHIIGSVLIIVGWLYRHGVVAYKKIRKK